MQKLNITFENGLLVREGGTLYLVSAGCGGAYPHQNARHRAGHSPGIPGHNVGLAWTVSVLAWLCGAMYIRL